MPEEYVNLRFAEVLKKKFFFHINGSLDYETVVRLSSAYQRGRIKNEDDFHQNEVNSDGYLVAFVNTNKDNFKIRGAVGFRFLEESFIKKSTDSFQWYQNPGAIFIEVTIPGNEWSGYIWFVAYDPEKDEVVLLSEWHYV